MKNIGKSVLLLLAVALAACSDGTVAPPSQRVAGPSAVGGSTADLSQLDTTRFSFVIDPAQSTSYYLGAGNTITFPAGSLCDLSSTYGMGHWDDPCVSATQAITVNAKAWLDRRGHPRVDFDKQIRFVPTSDQSKWVVISFTDYSGAYTLTSSVLYCPNVNAGECIDESRSDPSLATYKDSTTGRMSRRVKHFSGYNVFSGQPCDPSPSDPDCIYVADGLLSRAPTTTGSFSLSSSQAQQNQVEPAVRVHPLPENPTRSADIGPAGGELYLPQAGLTLVVPPGAVSQLTHFSVTPLAGQAVAYEFEPHGTHFNVPLTLRQDLRGIARRAGGHYVGAYFKNSSQVDPRGRSSLVDELLNANVNPLGEVEIQISHFSGYMLAWG